MKAIRDSRGIALLYFQTSALERGERSASRPGRFLPPRKIRYQLYRRLGGPQDRSGQVRKISTPPGFDPRTVKPVVSRYIDWATRPDHERQNLLVNRKLLWKAPSSLEQRDMHSLRNQLLYTDFFSTVLQFLCGYVESDRNSVISFSERLLKLVFYLFVFFM
jgi:hypothetical protein